MESVHPSTETLRAYERDLVMQTATLAVVVMLALAVGCSLIASCIYFF